MATVKLTDANTGKPISVNSDHIESLETRRRDSAQLPPITIVNLVSGDYHLVKESQNEVRKLAKM